MTDANETSQHPSAVSDAPKNDMETSARLAASQESEALRQLHILEELGLDPWVIEQFLDGGKLCYSHVEGKGRRLQCHTYFLSEEPEYVQIVEQLQETKGIRAFYCIETKTALGCTLSILRVSRIRAVWRYERDCLKDMEPSATVVDLSDKDAPSEETTIGLRALSGGFLRIW